MRKKNEKNFWDMEIIGNRRKRWVSCKNHYDIVMQISLNVTVFKKVGLLVDDIELFKNVFLMPDILSNISIFGATFKLQIINFVK